MLEELTSEATQSLDYLLDLSKSEVCRSISDLAFSIRNNVTSVGEMYRNKTDKPNRPLSDKFGEAVKSIINIGSRQTLGHVPQPHNCSTQRDVHTLVVQLVHSWKLQTTTLLLACRYLQKLADHTIAKIAAEANCESKENKKKNRSRSLLNRMLPFLKEKKEPVENYSCSCILCSSFELSETNFAKVFGVCCVLASKYLEEKFWISGTYFRLISEKMEWLSLSEATVKAPVSKATLIRIDQKLSKVKMASSPLKRQIDLVKSETHDQILANNEDNPDLFLSKQNIFKSVDELNQLEHILLSIFNFSLGCSNEELQMYVVNRTSLPQQPQQLRKLGRTTAYTNQLETELNQKKDKTKSQSVVATSLIDQFLMYSTDYHTHSSLTLSSPPVVTIPSDVRSETSNAFKILMSSISTSDNVVSYIGPHEREF